MKSSGDVNDGGGTLAALFVTLIAALVLYLILKQDWICGVGIIIVLIMGIIIIGDIILSRPVKSDSTYNAASRKPSTTVKKDGQYMDEDAEADEDLVIAYEAMNDWEDFEEL
jgi:hypothetical protein